MPVLHLHREIKNLNKLILQLGGHVEDNLRQGVQALQTPDATRSAHIVKEDVVVDSLEVRIEEECLKVLALHQPVASDLRYIVSILKINGDLERIGDLSSSLARNSSDLQGKPKVDIPSEFMQLATHSREMVHQSLDALVARDVSACQRILYRDNDVDKLYYDIKAWFIDQTKSHPDRTPAALEIFQASKNLERIADHACNIAEDIIYLVTGEIVRHHQLGEREDGVHAVI
jgi:phosphate transport system protein